MPEGIPGGGMLIITQRRPQGLLLDDFQNGGWSGRHFVKEKALGTRLIMVRVLVPSHVETVDGEV